MNEEAIFSVIFLTIIVCLCCIYGWFYIIEKDPITPPPTLATEKRYRDSYILAKNKGSAKYLYERCLLVHIFITSGEAKSWTRRSKSQVMYGASLAEQWITKKANEFKKDNLEFVDEVIILDKNFAIKHFILPKFRRYLPYTEEWYGLLVKSLGYDSWAQFVHDRKEKYNVQNIGLLIHLNYGSLSYAWRAKRETGQRIDTQYITEYAILFTHNRKGSIENASTYAHEMLHMFGADDLYNIIGAENYYPNDIMNHSRFVLDSNEISPLTAYAISWSDKMPRIKQFKVVEMN